jgi:acetyl esterase/lipase
MHAIYLGLLAIAVVYSGSTAAAQDELRVLRDLPYREHPDSDYQRERSVYDLYLPAGDGPFATLMWIHGGGLRNGHKADEIAGIVAERFAAEGIAVASINYRLHPQVEFPAYIEDAAAAYAHIRGHIAEHGGDPDRVFISGHSAGGYLTSMVGLDPQYLAKHDLKLADVAGMIPVSGQTITHTTVRAERDITQTIADDAAPLFYVTKDVPRTLCIAGGDDLPMRPEENRLFVAAMRAANHPDVAYLEVPGRDHGTVASRIGQPDDPVARAMLEFIQK